MATVSSRRGRAARAPAPPRLEDLAGFAIFHADGRLATGPLALCEVQGYVYGAKLGAARIARSLGEMPRAIALVESAQALQARFNTAFWCADIETYRAGARRRQAAVLRAHFEPGPLPVHRHRARRPRAADHRGPRRRAHVFGLGRALGGRERAALQPHVVSQRLGLAARQRVAGRRRRALRRQGVRAADPQLRSSRPPVTSTCSVCRNCSAASSGAAARRRCNFRWPVRRRQCSAGATFLLLQSVLGIGIDALDRQIVLAHPAVPDNFEEITREEPRGRRGVGGFHRAPPRGVGECQRRAARRESRPRHPQLIAART